MYLLLYCTVCRRSLVSELCPRGTTDYLAQLSVSTLDSGYYHMLTEVIVER